MRHLQKIRQGLWRIHGLDKAGQDAKETHSTGEYISFIDAGTSRIVGAGLSPEAEERLSLGGI